MPTFRLRHFSRPATLRAIDPRRLVAFLEPYRPFLALRGFTLPPASQAADLDYEGLVGVLLSRTRQLRRS